MTSSVALSQTPKTFQDAIGVFDSGVGGLSVLRAIRARLRAGSGLADAMRQQGTVFPETYLRLVALAEVSGTLPLVLNRIHAGRAQAQALRRKVGSALV